MVWRFRDRVARRNDVQPLKLHSKATVHLEGFNRSASGLTTLGCESMQLLQQHTARVAILWGC